MLLCAFLQSLPLRECGLKCLYLKNFYPNTFVTPLAGVWIEILYSSVAFCPDFVTPLAGVWIEIPLTSTFGHNSKVTPLAGVWIEISFVAKKIRIHLSLPLRECGLKSARDCHMPFLI